MSLAWPGPHKASPLLRTRSPRTKPSRVWHPCPLPRLSQPASYRTSSAHPPLCPRPSSPLPLGYRGPGKWDWGEGVPLGWAGVGVLDTEGPWASSHLCSSGAAPLSWDSSLDPLRSEYGGISFPHPLLCPGSHSGLPLPSGFQQQLSKVFVQK